MNIEKLRDDLRMEISNSETHAIRGYRNGECVVAVCFYDEKIRWLTGFDGHWAKNWEPIPDSQEEYEKLIGLDWRPAYAEPHEQLEREVQEALAEIFDDDDDFEPIGEFNE